VLQAPSLMGFFITYRK